ncbi:mitotic checkpoint regulator, MAD2B-interacting-domain-containing protein [Elsinoe ampelina]|uniref:Mitotic checkpoint regulator, MAD2B-interacting-domain-containing protein n=1 Tax=Elsinoe ampelina TaxID=302913 RepID=A0A6A6GRD0_9PEZI|nr:mitotic checkpoint regulator, MAD2B-interacting-domain-containing protein [Elsinoe ampelina]
MMALVGYSDSEESDTEVASKPEITVPAKSTKPAFEKLVDSSGPRKIKVDLPTIAPTADAEAERPAKRARTAGGISGFNALLPAPKRTAENAKRGGLGSGINLKTSSAAAFSREPVETSYKGTHESQAVDSSQNGDSASGQAEDKTAKAAEEVKAVGNAMRFRPLSVANKKKPKKPAAVNATSSAVPVPPNQTTAPAVPAPVVKPSKPKVSLFSVASEDDSVMQSAKTDVYEPLITQDEVVETIAPSYETMPQQPVNPNSLDAVASDLNLTEAERRQLFGRRGQGAQAINIANFNMDTEYAKNEELRAAGETVQHRAVRAVAPGKHSLQQLVNAASTQKEALEDAWAEGKRNRGEAGNKYGWGR